MENKAIGSLCSSLRLLHIGPYYAHHGRQRVYIAVAVASPSISASFPIARSLPTTIYTYHLHLQFTSTTTAAIMSGQLFNMVAKRVLKDTAKKNINSKVGVLSALPLFSFLNTDMAKDPYFEEVAVYGRDGRPTGKVKQQKKGIPAILSQHDGTILKKVRRRAYRLDMSLFNCFGIRFGWSSVIGIIPV